jgi:hypothetical protein
MNYDIKMDRGPGCEDVNWIELAQHWSFVVVMVMMMIMMNIVLYKSRAFLDQHCSHYVLMEDPVLWNQSVC